MFGFSGEREISVRGYGKIIISRWDAWCLYYLKRKVYIGHKAHEGWASSLPHYALICKEHGLVVAYPQGYGEFIECPFC